MSDWLRRMRGKTSAPVRGSTATDGLPAPLGRSASLRSAPDQVRSHSEGVRRPRAWYRPQAPTEFVVGLATAGRRALEELGEAATVKQEAASTIFDSIAGLRQALAKPAAAETDSAEHLAEVLMYAGALGSAATLAARVRLGHFDTLAEFAADRDRRRAGALKTNEKRASAKEKALAAAIAVLGTNPTLSADEAAPKIRERARLSTSLRTVAEWVRDWRRSGTIPHAR